MLRIYHSNRLDVLEEIMEFIISQQPLADVFAPEIILVQSSGMAQWLQMALAKRFSVAANIQFPLPARFIWQMFTCVLTDIPKENAFTRQNMHWKLMTLLPAIIDSEVFTPLQRYLRDDQDQRKLFQLCARIADLYDQYLIYRPQWLTCWQAGKTVPELNHHQHWQAQLWQTLVAASEPQCHKASLYQRFISQLANDKPPAGLPSRIFICGIPVLPQMYLQAFEALGRHCDIHLMVTNPCRYYWGDIRDATSQTRSVQRQYQHPLQHPLVKPTPSRLLTPDRHNDNPLLASWGKQGRDYIYLLAGLEQLEEIDAFAGVERDSLLHHLQADILELYNPQPASADPAHSQYKRPVNPADRSVTLHVCHSAQREMEVLHDQLLAMLEQDPQLTPRDIIVMVPDIDSYYPFIQTVFGAASNERHIPYAISDRRTRQIHPLLKAVISLLALPESRFTAEDVLQLLEVPALAGRFGIDESGLRHLRQWINESGIRWGLDDDHVQELELPVTGQHTWRFGLTRMLLGYAMDSHAMDSHMINNPDHTGQWQSVLPYDETSGLIAVLVGQLGELLEQLDNWRKTLACPRPAASWLPLCRELLACFFTDDPQTSELLTLVKRQWQTIITPILNAGYPHPLPVAMLRDEIENQLEHERVSQRFLAGAVNFCTLMPMRSIPFNVICLAGMNDGVYPRPTQPLGFDLIRQHPLKGDRSRRDDDRYLLLEALISARQTLYISYIGRSVQDNRLCFPSVLIQELIDYITQNHCLAGDEISSAETSAQNLRQHLTCQHPRTPFDADNFRPGDLQQSYASHWLPAASGQGQAHSAFIQPLPKVQHNEVDTDTLQRFWRHPVRSFFRMRLQVSLDHDADELPDSEPFDLNALQRYQLNQQLLNALTENQDTDVIYQRYRGAGQLPYAAFGDQLWQQHLSDMQTLADKIRPYRTSGQPLEIDLTIANTHITGWLTQVQHSGLLHWHPSRLDARHGLSLWLEHLLCCASGKASDSRAYGKDSQWHFPSLKPAAACQLLHPLITGYQQGLNQPLRLLPKSAGAWLNACYDPHTRQINGDEDIQRKARNKLADTWRGSYQQQGEGEDPYYQRLYRSLTPDYCQAIIAAATTYLLPLWQHNEPEEIP